ncbi:winged helix-turn-helix domain-containing protein [Pseudooceanicola sp. C21-150M6]|uniref:winged helix-turn-helix domain-containing protein n=1 Tax=Pseudooceanicola sp. C21-150M6 TaxID=3434355 RepID=UPI003D7F8FFA
MQIYLYEPRADRLNGVMDELRMAKMRPVAIQDTFFTGDLTLVNRDGHEDRPFLLADTPSVIDQITTLRAAGLRNPIIVVRDFRSSRDTAMTLDAGADDDIVIPIKSVELRSRINSITRRAHGHSSESIQVGEITAFFDGRDPEVCGGTVKLSRREHAIFQQLVLQAGKVVSKGAIYDAVYGMAEDQPFDKVIDVYICKIRKKIDAAAQSGHHYIETVHGRGYKLTSAEEKLRQAGNF